MTEQPVIGQEEQPRDREEFQIVALAADWAKIRAEARFVELMRLARLANSLSLVYAPIERSQSDQTPRARRERFAGLFHSAALLKEGLHTVRGLGQWYRHLPQFEGFVEIFRDPVVSKLESGLLDTVRDKLVFHFDRDAIVTGLDRSPLADYFVMCTYPTSGPAINETYFDTADDIVLWYLFGEAKSDKDYMEQLETFTVGVSSLLTRFLIASHRLIAAGFLELGCRKTRKSRPE